MIKGHTFELQTFSAEAFSEFVEVFLNKNNGVVRGCEIIKQGKSITIKEGVLIVKGRIIEIINNETKTVEGNGNYSLVLEINLNETNTKDELKQVKLKLIQSENGIPSLIQQEINSNGKIYQYEICRFNADGTNINDLENKTKPINYENLIKIIKEKINQVENGSIYITRSEFENAKIKIKSGTDEPTTETLEDGEVYIQYFD